MSDKDGKRCAIISLPFYIIGCATTVGIFKHDNNQPDGNFTNHSVPEDDDEKYSDVSGAYFWYVMVGGLVGVAVGWALIAFAMLCCGACLQLTKNACSDDSNTDQDGMRARLTVEPGDVELPEAPGVQESSPQAPGFTA